MCSRRKPVAEKPDGLGRRRCGAERLLTDRQARAPCVELGAGAGNYEEERNVREIK